MTWHCFFPSSAATASRVRCAETSRSSFVRPHSPIPGSIEAIFAFASTVSRTALTWQKRFAHSSWVMMITSSEPTIARCRFSGGAIGKRTSARPRRTCVSLFMITGHAPRSTQTSATARASSSRSSSQMIVTTSPSSIEKHSSTTSAASFNRLLDSTTVAMRHLTLSAENWGRTSFANRSTCANWSIAPNRQMKWSTPASANVRIHSAI